MHTENNIIQAIYLNDKDEFLFPIFNNILYIREQDLTFFKCSSLHKMVELNPDTKISTHYRDTRAADEKFMDIYIDLIFEKLLSAIKNCILLASH